MKLYQFSTRLWRNEWVLGESMATKATIAASHVRSLLRRIVGDQRGVTVIEYALIVFLIGTAAIGAMTTLGLSLFNLAGPVATAWR
jgi:Flp pilus assembly pilin Flp